ncbi:MAG: hypothetical protein EOP46_10220 [Sphingobacteriaceae bacterium]|nr:MAG: hypothetical protein EOP46_10220 [Sphingobacteriaceae bacterium]
MKYIIYLFYKYYNKGSGANFAYESALFAVTFLIFLNLLALINLFDMNYLLLGLEGRSRGGLYLIFGAFYILPMYLILFFIYKKETVVNTNYDPSKEQVHGWLLFAYCIFSIIALVFAIQYRR